MLRLHDRACRVGKEKSLGCRALQYEAEGLMWLIHRACLERCHSFQSVSHPSPTQSGSQDKKTCSPMCTVQASKRTVNAQHPRPRGHN